MFGTNVTEVFLPAILEMRDNHLVLSATLLPACQWQPAVLSALLSASLSLSRFDVAFASHLAARGPPGAARRTRPRTVCSARIRRRGVCTVVVSINDLSGTRCAGARAGKNL